MEEKWHSCGVRFKCTGCGKCCTGEPGHVWLTPEDIKALAKELALSETAFIQKHTRLVQGRLSLNEHPRTYDCEFYRDKRCLVYKARPVQCRTFPFWPENLVSERAWNALANRCEGVNHKDAPLIQMSEIEKWKQLDPEMRREIERLEKEDPKELFDAFGARLHFGTAGMRERMGVGPGRLNKYTVRMATLGLARVLKKGKVFIGYDNRHHSREFAHEAAKVLSGAGIAAIITPDLRPTPLVSFGCRYLHCSAAIMITASHNPASYNGYKVYWADGAQVVPPHDKMIIDEVAKITDPLSPPLSDTLITYSDETLDSAFLAAIRKEPIAHPPHVVYSPLCGAGITLMPQALAEAGITKIDYVEEQKTPNGDFPTLPKPNPEEPEALTLGIEKMVQVKADLFMASDPDSDRIGFVALYQGKPVRLTGNQIAALCVDYLTSQPLPKNAAFITTIVTTDLFKMIVQKRGYHLAEVLTGFKYIGEQIEAWETSKEHTFIFGAEESYGYLYGTHARDKDALSAATLVCRMSAEKNLVERLHALYDTFGLFTEGQHSIACEASSDAMAQMKARVDSFRKTPPSGTVRCIDYLHDKTGLPKSDVLVFYFDDDSKLIIRPSGTEPKIKIYAMARGDQERLAELFKLVESHA